MEQSRKPSSDQDQIIAPNVSEANGGIWNSKFIRISNSFCVE